MRCSHVSTTQSSRDCEWEPPQTLYSFTITQWIQSPATAAPLRFSCFWTLLFTVVSLVETGRPVVAGPGPSAQGQNQHLWVRQMKSGSHLHVCLITFITFYSLQLYLGDSLVDLNTPPGNIYFQLLLLQLRYCSCTDIGGNWPQFVLSQLQHSLTGLLCRDCYYAVLWRTLTPATPYNGPFNLVLTIVHFINTLQSYRSVCHTAMSYLI